MLIRVSPCLLIVIYLVLSSLLILNPMPLLIEDNPILLLLIERSWKTKFKLGWMIVSLNLLLPMFASITLFYLLEKGMSTDYTLRKEQLLIHVCLTNL